MQNAEKKSGTVPFFDPLSNKINDCFGALKEVKPDVLFGTHSGLKVQSGDEDVIELEGDTEDTQEGDTASSEASNQTPKKNKQPNVS